MIMPPTAARTTMIRKQITCESRGNMWQPYWQAYFVGVVALQVDYPVAGICQFVPEKCRFTPFAGWGIGSNKLDPSLLMPTPLHVPGPPAVGTLSDPDCFRAGREQ